ncbi:hypothetical protein [Streptomyces sp. NRRL F-2664]|uniref:hypothetical protein n=1 Tax=Streptomyces sp. NRRL F-2664 TaxID=1463842 RepID=UPI0005BA9571|nr:hypothetical protein [Streptomyces sp. NRRL F-2664]
MKRSDLTTATVLAAVRDHATYAFERLASQYPPKVVQAAFDRDGRKGLLECGVSLQRPWLSPAGRWYLQVDRSPCDRS